MKNIFKYLLFSFCLMAFTSHAIIRIAADEKMPKDITNIMALMVKYNDVNDKSKGKVEKRENLAKRMPRGFELDRNFNEMDNLQFMIDINGKLKYYCMARKPMVRSESPDFIISYSDLVTQNPNSMFRCAER